MNKLHTYTRLFQLYFTLDFTKIVLINGAIACLMMTESAYLVDYLKQNFDVITVSDFLLLMFWGDISYSLTWTLMILLLICACCPFQYDCRFIRHMRTILGLRDKPHTANLIYSSLIYLAEYLFICVVSVIITMFYDGNLSIGLIDIVRYLYVSIVLYAVLCVILVLSIILPMLYAFIVGAILVQVQELAWQFPLPVSFAILKRINFVPDNTAQILIGFFLNVLIITVSIFLIGNSSQIYNTFCKKFDKGGSNE